MTNVISTWFYVQGREEGGSFAQLREDSASERFRDIYRRCIAVFFATARRANPEAKLVLYLNTAWAESESLVAREVGALMEALSVEHRVIPYRHEPPASFSKAWRNQFFVIDVLGDVQQRLSADDAVVILDSDIIWTSRVRAESLWADLSRHRLATYKIGYAASTPVNGQSIDDLTAISKRLNGTSSLNVSYCGGEIVGATAGTARQLAVEASNVWTELMEFHSEDPSLAFEEAHVLSLAYASLGHKPGSFDEHIRRLWTQPFKPKNSRREDLSLTLWHAPAEKKYGFRRIYGDLLSMGLDAFLAQPDHIFIRRNARRLGIPRNNAPKVVRDAAYAGLARVLNDRDPREYWRPPTRKSPGAEVPSTEARRVES